MKKPGIIKDRTFLLHSPDHPHVENPERLIAINQMLEGEKLLNELTVLTPRFATNDEIELIHPPIYVKEIEETSQNESSQLDGDTYTSRETFKSALLAAGSTIECVEKTFRGEVPSSFAFIRPPGHHAEKDRAMGFCIFNNIAIGAQYALKKLGLNKIAIVDFDLHHGNGTQNAFYKTDEVLFISSHQFPHYPGTGSMKELGSGKGEGYTINIPLPVGFGDTEYSTIYWEIINPVLKEYNPDLILISAGFDTYISDPLSGMEITGEGFYDIVSAIRDASQKCCDGKMIFALEGGYSPIGLKEGCFNVLKCMLGHKHEPKESIKSKLSENFTSTVENIKSNIKNYWNI